VQLTVLLVPTCVLIYLLLDCPQGSRPLWVSTLSLKLQRDLTERDL